MSLPDRVRNWLNEESALWTKEGLIDESQRGRILARYPATEAGSGRMTFVLRALGVLTLFAAILLVIGHNWEDLSRTGRMAVVVAGLIVIQGIGLTYLVRGRPQGASLGLLAGCLMYGAAIALTGQIFHLDAHAPDAILAWALGTLPFALLLDSTLLHLLYVTLAAIWYIWEMEQRGYGWRGSNELTALAFLLLLAPSAWAGYRNSRPVLVGLTALGWLVAGSMAMSVGAAGLNPVFLVAPLALAALHHPGDPRSRGWRVAGLIPATCLTLALGFINSGESIIGEIRGHFYWNETPLLTVIGLAALVLGAWKACDRHGRHAAWLAIAISATYTLLVLGHGNAAIASLCTALGNVLTLGLAITQIRLGLSEGRLRPYVYGCIVFLVWLLVRYADIHEELGMLGMAAVLAVIGVGLFALARLWRSLSEEPVGERMDDFRPAAMESVLDRIQPRTHALLIAACAAQVAVIGFMVWNHLQPLWHGERIVVRAELVDPRDILKGEYVILSYDFGHLDNEDYLALRKELGWDEKKDPSGRLPENTLVFVPMVKQPNGEWIGGKATLTRPSSGIYLIGRPVASFLRLHFGIEAFYVQEGKGVEWEKLRNSGLLKVTVAVLPNGQAGLVSLEADKEPFVELKGWRVLRGWKAANEWNEELVDNAKRFEKTVVRTLGKDASAPFGQVPDFSKERVVILSHASGLNIKVESNGNVTRIGQGERVTGEGTRGESLILAIPRSQQAVITKDNRRLRSVEPEREDPTLDASR